MNKIVLLLVVVATLACINAAPQSSVTGVDPAGSSLANDVAGEAESGPEGSGLDTETPNVANAAQNIPSNGGAEPIDGNSLVDNGAGNAEGALDNSVQQAGTTGIRPRTVRR